MQTINVHDRINTDRNSPFAPLSELGKEQANKVADNSMFSHSEIIVSSPYTRALQTAMAIARKTGLENNVKTDLHEFVPDKTYQASNVEEENLLAEFSSRIVVNTMAARGGKQFQR